MTEPAETLVFIDTNIWLYAFSRSQDVQKTAHAQRLIRQTPSIAISTQIINEICVNMLRKFGASEFDVQKLVRSMYHNYLVVELNRQIIVDASVLRAASQFSFWDSLVVVSALSVGATILYSEDLQSQQVVAQRLTIINPLLDSFFDNAR